MATVTTCPVCGNPLRIHQDAQGAEVGANCTACRWEPSVAWKMRHLANPWRRSSPETFSCEECGVDHPAAHAVGCSWSTRGR